MKENLAFYKIFAFAIRIVKMYQFLTTIKKEFVMSRQLLKSGTAVGAMIREAEHSESKADFIHKMSIAQKEINESIYWLELLSETEIIAKKEFDSINEDAIVIIKLITAIIKSTKQNLNNN
ncbi:MAG: four helix bundle protein [Chitinophagales bacterium]|nr:four helix bundle protein [Bacteroidota bacterium]MCB9044184.1 four helix bundle protein [Chitinophagales bacterium]